jgi:uncharacterized membrane protein
MKQSLVLYAVVLFATLILDALWLGFVMAKTYQTDLRAFLRFKPEGGMDPIIWAAGIVYFLIPFGVIYFALPKVVEGDGWISSALCVGAVLGLVIYGIYDFTNYSLIKDWPLKLTLIDWAWGGTLGALVTLAAAWVRRS